MARRSLLPIVCGPATAGVLLAAAGCGGAPEDAAGGGGFAQPAEAGSPPVAVTGTPHVDAEGSVGARPGAPFDVEAFERIGATYAEFLESGAGNCDGGRCTLSYEFVESRERESGCAVADVRYRPPEQPDPQNPGRYLVQRGAAVTVVIRCAPGVSPEEAATLEGSTDEGSTDEGTG